MMPTLLTMVAPQVVIMTNSSNTSENRVGVTTTPTTSENRVGITKTPTTSENHVGIMTSLWEFSMQIILWLCLYIYITIFIWICCTYTYAFIHTKIYAHDYICRKVMKVASNVWSNQQIWHCNFIMTCSLFYWDHLWTWITNYINIKIWDVIIHPCSNCYGGLMNNAEVNEYLQRFMEDMDD